MPWFISTWPFGLLYQSLFGGFMKSVTIENVKARIAQIEANQDGMKEYGFDISIPANFELACLRSMLELEARCAALAAENAGLKELIEQHANSVAVCPNCSHEEPSETDDIVALYRSMETPETDAFLAEVRAQGVEMCSAEIQKQTWDEREGDGIVAAIDAMEIYASQIRKGAQS